MPQVNSRYAFQELFSLPRKYETIDFVEFTTYSIAPSFIIAIPHLIYCSEMGFDYSDISNIIIRNNKNFIKDKAPYKKFGIFYDGNDKPIPDLNRFSDSRYAAYGLKLIDDHCISIKMSEKLFHPKIAVIQFGNNSDNKYFRVMISSRNLTCSNYFEGGVILEGENLKEHSNKENKNGKKIGVFFESLYKNYLKDKNNRLDIKKLKCTELKLKYGNIENIQKNADAEIHFGGLDELEDNLKKKIFGDSIINSNTIIRITSPFIKDIFNKHKDRIEIISNNKSFSDSKEFDKYKNENKAIIVKNQNNVSVPVLLHIKQYLLKETDNQENVTIWIGSANFTEPGLTKNIECMVKFKSHNKSCNMMPNIDDNKSHFYKTGDISLRYNKPSCNEDKEELDKEEQSKVDITVKGKYEDKKLKLTIDNSVHQDIYVYPALMGYFNKKKIESNTDTEFDIRLRDLSNYVVMIIDELSYLKKIQWESNKKPCMSSMEEILGLIMPKLITSVKDFIPTVRNQRNSEDEAYEKLVKYYLSGKSLNFIEERIDNICSKYFKWFEDVKKEKKQWDNIEEFNKWNKIEEFKTLKNCSTKSLLLSEWKSYCDNEKIDYDNSDKYLEWVQQNNCYSDDEINDNYDQMKQIYLIKDDIIILKNILRALKEAKNETN